MRGDKMSIGLEPSELLDLINQRSLIEVVFRYWLGRWPEQNEKQLVEMMMVVVIDHGEESPSARASIEASQRGEDLLRSVEAGVHEINERHGGAIEGLGRILYEDTREVKEIVADFLSQEKRLPGFGHRIYKDVDPRTKCLFEQAKKLGFAGNYVDKTIALEEELEIQKGNKLVINIDGAMAALLCELGVKTEMMNAFFLWPRVAGLVHRWQVTKAK